MAIPAKLIQTVNVARSGLYFMESLPFLFINRFVTHSHLEPLTDEHMKMLWKYVIELHEREGRHIERGTYSWRALQFENPWRHARSFFELIGDGLKIAWRMRGNDTKAFTADAAELARELPEYYTRNFHFQTDGYLSEASARRYNHQVEILFNGTAGAMRRMILPILKMHTKGTGRWLELGSGNGSATRPVLETFPKARVTALDLSSPYLRVAREYLQGYRNVDFAQGDATHMNYRDESFDAIYSVYVLHEMPRAERERLVREAYRVLKPGGLLLLADSLQYDDEPDLNMFIERFPKVYHEPFYKDYSLDPMDQLLTKVTGQPAEKEHVFFTKLAWVKKPSLG